jgi:ATP-binding cassette subfamily A (ABC1) protein 3
VLFGLALMSVSLFLTTVFTDSKLSAQVGLYILLFPTSIFLYSVSYRLNAEVDYPFTFDGNPWFQLWYVIPNFSFGVVLIDYYIHDGAKVILGLHVSVAWVCLLLSIPFYFCMYMWVDAIMPNTFGIRESLCFCLKKKKTQVEWAELGENNPNDELARFVGAGLDGARDQAPIKIRNLTKKFGKFVAVDKLNLEVSSNDVLCLLGHNGAGKTTAINMLTGMI